MKALISAGVMWVVATLTVVLISCSDHGARKDLPQDNQKLDTTDASIIVMPDQFPNIAHKCQDTTGFWVTTDRLTVIVYNDPACHGEGTVFVISNVPGRNP